MQVMMCKSFKGHNTEYAIDKGECISAMAIVIIVIIIIINHIWWTPDGVL